MKKAEIKILAEKEAGAVENYFTPDDRQMFINGYTKATEYFLNHQKELLLLYEAVLQGKQFTTDKVNRIIKVKE